MFLYYVHGFVRFHRSSYLYIYLFICPIEFNSLYTVNAYKNIPFCFGGGPKMYENVASLGFSN